jgi:hypothetical protein
MLEEFSTAPPNSNSENEAKLRMQNPSKQVQREPSNAEFEPGRTFFPSQRFQVMPFADGLRIAHSFGEFAQSLFA